MIVAGSVPDVTKRFPFYTLVNEYWTLHDFLTKPEFRDEYIVVLLTKFMRGENIEYDVMIIDAVQTYILFRGGRDIHFVVWLESTLPDGF